MISEKRKHANLVGIPVFEIVGSRTNASVVKEAEAIKASYSTLSIPNADEKSVVRPVVSEEEVVGLVVECHCGCNTTVLFDAEETSLESVLQEAEEPQNTY